MNKNNLLLTGILVFLTSCASRYQPDQIVSIQMMDRNGFSETISSKDRLNIYQSVDFLTAQPYQKVLRVYGKDQEGKSRSKLTNYHPNGSVWKYLEALDGRANGKYLEWHENGKLKIEAFVIEGLADLNEAAQKSWIFDGKSFVWDEKGNKIAAFTYEKGILEGEAKYFHPNGQLHRVIPYEKGEIHGVTFSYDSEGNPLEELAYKQGKKEGPSKGFWTRDLSQYQEQWRENLLINAIYFDNEGIPIAEIENGHGTKAIFLEDRLHTLIQFQEGEPMGEVKIFSKNGRLYNSYYIKDGKKHGEEWEYYPGEKEDDPRPKLMITWYEDVIQGMTKTWYDNGLLESQKEMSGNQKHGLSFAYYRNGDLMLMEEYDNDKLIRGSYYKIGERQPVSTIVDGKGIATLFNEEGHFIRKIPYESCKPVVDP